MIFKEQDVINLAIGKNATQSSISIWSHIDDANRAINYDLGDINFAFHTGLEDNPYWMIDLENIEPIDCIRIANRKENNKDIKRKRSYILSYIKETHQNNQKFYQEKIKANPSLKLLPLETYPDYNEAIKIKEHLSYKFGEAMIEADKSLLKLMV